MFQIIVASNEKTFEQLTQILKQFFEMSIITSECIRIKKSCEIMVIRANSIKNLNVDRGVLVVSDCSNIVLNECVCPIVIAEGNKVFSCGKFFISICLKQSFR